MGAGAGRQVVNDHDRPAPSADPHSSSVALWLNAKGKRQYRIYLSAGDHPDVVEDLADRALSLADRLEAAEAGPLGKTER